MEKRKTNIIPRLKELIDCSYEDKLSLTQFIINKRISELGDACAVAWSGGKDSTIILRMVLDKLPRVPVVFGNTGVEYPETISYVREITKLWNLNLYETRPVKNYWQCVKDYGFPTTKDNRTNHHSTRCCYWLKEKPAAEVYKQLNTKGVFTGITAVESRARQIRAITHGTCYQLKGLNRMQIHPILYWTQEDVWKYANDNQIPMNPIYTKGFERCGCSICTAFLSWEPLLQQYNPKLYALIKERKAQRELVGVI